MTAQCASRSGLTRRRFVSVLAAASIASLVPGGARARHVSTFTWEGIALGAKARLSLQHRDPSVAKSAIAACLDEVARLEAIFSLYREDSALVRLNTSGRLDAAPADLRLLLAEALALAERSNGAFDPTVQPLWSLFARHFSDPGADPEGPPRDAIEKTAARVGWRKVAIEGATIRLCEPGMALTLNGIAQGYITDKVADLLRERGFRHVLVDMGEQLALGPKWDGEAWRVGIANPAAPDTPLLELPLTNGAIATSGGYGYRFDPIGSFTHIIEPNTGVPARRVAGVTVVADLATTADGLSTALAVVPAERAPAILPPKAHAYLIPIGSQTGYWL
jgi:thiamine biosynthesis lipoprotein